MSDIEARVKKIIAEQLGVPEADVANDKAFVADLGADSLALVEITLDRQGAEHLDAFEARVLDDSAVQQCYRVSPGPDFVLVLHVAGMSAYQALVQRLFTQDANVRNVKTFFSVKRAKFDTRLPWLVQTAPT